MTAEMVIRIVREGLLLVLLVSAAPMLASMIVGFLVSVFQATTQIQEQTLSYVPKLIAVFVTLAIMGPWMLAQTAKFARTLLDSIAYVK
ncbi:MAG TPA: flagellar biosynthesis protein FliQ [Bryobacteraceae bacterium]|nr:flagellar biosynthesis protein FliQ [Bryobacteraceae bacterium]